MVPRAERSGRESGPRYLKGHPKGCFFHSEVSNSGFEPVTRGITGSNPVRARGASVLKESLDAINAWKTYVEVQ